MTYVDIFGEKSKVIHMNSSKWRNRMRSSCFQRKPRVTHFKGGAEEISRAIDVGKVEVSGCWLKFVMIRSMPVSMYVLK
jgi:hypothetical protein